MAKREKNRVDETEPEAKSRMDAAADVKNTPYLRASEISRKKKLVFGLITILLPFGFFLLLESGLRLAGYGEDYPLFIAFENDREYQFLNPEVGKRYFPDNVPVPNGNTDFFKVEKPEGGLRIIVQGGSSAAGYPYYRGGSFSRMLRNRLQRGLPDREIEVINTGIPAVNSYTLLDFVDEIVAVKPDAVLIYAGHNEYYGAMGVGSSVGWGSSPFFKRWYLRLQKYRVIQLLKNVLVSGAGLFSPGDQEGGSTLMERMVKEQQIVYQGDLFQQGIRQFEENLGEILARYRTAGIPVFLGTLASNEHDQVPFVSEDLAGPDSLNRLSQITEAAELKDADWEAARKKTEDLLRENERSARLHFLLGQILEKSNDETNLVLAKNSFTRAKDLDALRFRAPEEINGVIAAAGGNGVYVVESKKALEDHSPGGVVGNVVMLEHLHPNLEGYRILADAFFQSVVSELGLDRPEGAVQEGVTAADVRYSDADSVLAAYRIATLMSRWPFTRQLESTRPRLGAPQSEAERTAQQLYENSVSWFDGLSELADTYASVGDFSRARRVWQTLADEYPMLEDLRAREAVLFAREGSFGEAESTLRHLRRVSPETSMTDLYSGLASELLQAEQPEAATFFFQRAWDEKPTADAGKMLGGIMLQESQVQNDPAKRKLAIQILGQALGLSRSDSQIRYNLAGAFALDGKLGLARAHIDTLLSNQPGHNGGLALKRQLTAGR